MKKEKLKRRNEEEAVVNGMMNVGMWKLKS